jgi:hypothetical protein
MPDAASRWVLDDPTATAKRRLDGRLLYVLKQRREDHPSLIKTAAMAQSLRSLADALERTCLDRQAGEVLAEVDVTVTVKDDEPANGR